MRPSRRAFLTGFSTAADPWTRFCRRLARCIHGRVEPGPPSPDGADRAALYPAREEDLLHARALCVETGTLLVLAGCPVPDHIPALIVHPHALNAVRRLADGRIIAQAGASVRDLRPLLPELFQAAPDDALLAQWLAQVSNADFELVARYLLAVDVLLAEGAIERFGPFGADVQREPLSDAARSLVSQLFILVNSPEYRAWRHLPAWPARYRLDALLLPEQNLAHVWPGSQGSLGWLLSAHFLPAHAASWPAAPDAGQGPIPENPSDSAPLHRPPSPARIFEFEEDVKLIFDPRGLFPRLSLPVV